MAQESVSILNELIQVTKDSEDGFRTAADNVEDASLKNVFVNKAQTCSNIVSDLQNKVRELGGDFEERGSVLGAMHRGWVTIKSTLTGKDSHAVLAECERGEDVIKAAYSKALESPLSENIRPLVQRHYESVVRDHDMIRDLRDKYAQNKQNSL